MNTNERSVKKLALLIGGNPLPNYIATQVLKPQEVVLVYTKETKKPCDYLEEIFKKQSIRVFKAVIIDATDAHSIRDTCRSLSDVDHLHYSGGTKPMAAHALIECKLDEQHISYLDERKGILRFDDGQYIALEQRNLNLTLDIILNLHGINEKNSNKQLQGYPTSEDVTEMTARIVGKPRVAGDPKVAQNIYDSFHEKDEHGKYKSKKFESIKKQPWIAAKFNLSLSTPTIPCESWNKDLSEKWAKFLCGGWLDRWAEKVIRSCLNNSTYEIKINVICETMQSPTFEIDIALVIGHRLYVVSCTTTQNHSLCKSKLFEVAMRARQMGRDLARSALICLRDGANENGSYVQQLRDSIAVVWERANKPQVFGLSDLQEWIGVNSEPNIGSLKQWLES